MNLVVFLLISTLFLSAIEIIKRKFSISSGTTRRISHIGSAIICAASPLFIEKNLIVFVCLGFAGIMLISRKFNILLSIHRIRRDTFGEVFLPLGEAFSAAIFLPYAISAFQYGVLVMGLSDAFAGFVGKKYGKHQINIFNNRKSLEGSLAFLLTTILLTFFFAPHLGPHLILIPLALTFVELVLGYGIDNLAIPILAALLLHFSNYLL